MLQIHKLTENVKDEIKNFSEKRKVVSLIIIANKPVHITECPRDAMQGIKPFITTEKKALYINALLKVGFDTIDFGSFVSPKAIPQLRDTAQVLEKLEMDKNNDQIACNRW